MAPVAVDQRPHRRGVRGQAEARERRVDDPAAHAGLEQLPGDRAECRRAENATHLVLQRGEAAPDVVALGEERIVEVEDDHPQGDHASASRETKIASS